MNAFAMRMEMNANFMNYLQWGKKKRHVFLINSVKDELKRIVMVQKNREYYSHVTSRRMVGNFTMRAMPYFVRQYREQEKLERH